MIGIWFTFRDDAPCLIESTAQFRETFPGMPVALCDEGIKPLPRAVVDFIAPDHYERSDVRRNGNLIGPEAACMELDFQERMHLRFQGHKGALKIDCDTLVFDGGWIDEDAPQCGFFQGPLRFIWGPARYVSAEACSAAFDSILSRPIGVMRGGNEDQIIGIEISTLFGDRCRIMPALPDTMAYWHYRGGNYQEIMGAPVVVFGNRMEISCRSCETREIVAKTMAKFRCARKDGGRG